MPAEVEAKLLSDGPGPLIELAGLQRLGAADLGPPQTVDEVDRYLDTPNGRLSDARWACRLREREGVIRVSLKGPMRSRGGGWLHDRPELEGPASASTDPASWPPSKARSLLDELRAGERLVEQLRLVQRRTERTVTVDAHPPLGTLTLDEVTVRSADRDGGQLFVVELELRGDHGDEEVALLTDLAHLLAARPGLKPDPRSKLEHALERLGFA